MKKNQLIISMIIIMILLTSCSIEAIDPSERIVAPSNKLLPIKGKWVIEKIIDSPYKKTEEELNKKFINKEILFHKDGVIVGDQYIIEPAYNIKNVRLSDYLLYKFKIGVEYLGIEDGETEIIKIMVNDQYLYEFIKYTEDEMIVLVEEQFLILKKKTNEVSKEEINNILSLKENRFKPLNMNNLETLNTGLLLGIKTYEYDKINKIDNWTYKTIWVKSNNRKVSSVYEMEKLLLPRKKGFWLVDVEREKRNDIFIDEIKSTPETILKKENKISSMNANDGSLDQSILKNILYLGNDYISLELINESTNKRILELYLLDNMEKGPATILSDIISEQDIKIDLKENENNELDTSNFGLVRRNGYWIIKGRKNYIKENKNLHEEYNIKLIPPKDLVGYDNLVIPWSMIKEKFPSANDAFISPNEDIIIIDTRKDILIYPIQDNEILEKELGKIKKNTKDTIIMAEWSTDIYTNLWEEKVLENNGQAMDYD